VREFHFYKLSCYKPNIILVYDMLRLFAANVLCNGERMSLQSNAFKCTQHSSC